MSIPMFEPTFCRASHFPKATPNTQGQREEIDDERIFYDRVSKNCQSIEQDHVSQNRRHCGRNCCRAPSRLHMGSSESHPSTGFNMLERAKGARVKYYG